VRRQQVALPATLRWWESRRPRCAQ
jgi:hypothetical protein